MKSKVKKILAICAVVFIMTALAIPTFAAGNDTASEAVSAVSSTLTQVTGTLSIGNIVSVLAIVLGVAIGFFFFWWGVRKVIRVAKSAFAKGKVSV